MSDGAAACVDPPAVAFESVDILFGDNAKARRRALQLLDAGGDRAEILGETGCVVGVAGATLAVRPGELAVLMGLSGSGKSTLLRSVNGLTPVSRGRVLVADGDGAGTGNGKGNARPPVDVGRCGARALRRLRRRRVSMVFQQFALLPWRSVADNVGFGLELAGASRAERERRVAEKLELVGLGDWRDQRIDELSGGMQQRVGLARAFATDADILLMDEPFSALDPLIRGRLQDELLALQRRLRKTIVFVSHDLDEALKLGTHISIMEDGRVVQHGTPEQIVLRPASAYVADFVAHMNPLGVLRGASIMTPLAALPRRDGRVVLGADVLLELSAGGEPLGASAGGRALTLAAEPHRAAPGQLALATPEIVLGEALAVRHRTGLPLLLLERQRAVGVIGDDEIYAGMLRQTSAGPAASGSGRQEA